MNPQDVHFAGLGPAGIEWASRVRHATRLLFWTVLASVLLANLLGSVVALAGGTYQMMKWVVVIPVLAGFPILVAILGITRPEPVLASQNGTDGVRTSLRICGVALVASRCGQGVSMHTLDVTDTLYVMGVDTLIESAAIVLLFIYLRGLAARFEEARLARSLSLVAWAFVLEGAGSLFTMGVEHWDSVPLAAYQLVSNGITLLDLFAGVWGLVTVWRFGDRLPVAAKGRCLCCGYLLKGLTQPRCPECGADWSRG